jgi:hypothetical protein
MCGVNEEENFEINSKYYKFTMVNLVAYVINE